LKYYIGYDIGAISVNRAVLDENRKIIEVLPYTRHYGEPVKVILQDIENLKTKKEYEGTISGIAFTGSGGKYLSSILNSLFVNEIEAIITSVKLLNPDINAVIEIGGQDSKFIDLFAGDYSMNELCAAGTGSFLDQQASRFGLTIEQFALLALKSENPSSIAGRCSVFAKSDMIHLQQEAASDEDIALGLCFAMARSFRSGIIRGKKLEPPVMFCGGVSYNPAMLRAFEAILEQKIIIPSHRESYGAIGAALSIIDRKAKDNKDKDKDVEAVSLSKTGSLLEKYLKNYIYEKEVFRPLVIEKSVLPEASAGEYDFDPEKLRSVGVKMENGLVEAAVGIDVGSISTNVVAIDSNKNLIYKVYLRTAGRPMEAVRKGIEIIGDKIGSRISVKSVGTTGSGRYLIGDLVGADIIINEITAQATAAAAIDPEVDTIFEIGGQDSKYISLSGGVVVDFEMNKICAAGTGSFLEEQSERFDIKIEEFGDRAMTATAPLNLGERCTVFMETNVYSHYQKGAGLEDILAGLAYSIAINYINRVVARKKIGNKIFFQGAVAFNKAVVAAFENYLDKKIIVPSNHEVTGAIGTAIRALENRPVTTKFRGFDEVKNIKYSQSSFECKGCPNVCEIKKVLIDNTKPLFYGGRCEKYEKKQSDGEKLKDLFAERDEILLNSYAMSKYGKTATGKNAGIIKTVSGKNDEIPEKSVLPENSLDGGAHERKTKIGIPFTMLTYEFYPFWEAFFTELGLELVLSDKTNKKIISDGLSLVVAESCFPIKVILGHVENLLEKGVDYIFVPAIRDMPCPDNRIEGARTGSYPCPFIQGVSSFVKASMGIDPARILDPLVNFSFREYLKNEQLLKLGVKFGKKKSDIKSAIKAAYSAQELFYRMLHEKGMQVMAELEEGKPAAVIISRPYNSCDANISMNIPGKLRDIGIQAIPMDYLPLDEIDLFANWPNMYWEFGDRILSAVEIVKKDRKLYPVYITNFGCGPDSFIMQYFEREIDRPYLKIEVDEHTAGAGVITRCEAFYDSLVNISNLEKRKKLAVTGKGDVPGSLSVPISAPTSAPTSVPTSGLKPDLPGKSPEFKRSQNRKIYIPYMGDGAYALEAVFRSEGIDAQVMHSDYETLEIGRKHTLGKECYPYILTTGDILKTLKYNDPKKCAFLMPLTHGPCRFGQYNKMQSILIKELGYGDVPIIAPGAPESAQFYKEYDMQGSKGSRLLLRGLTGIFAIDNLNKLLRKTRPYEATVGQSYEIYENFLSDIRSEMEKTTGRGLLNSLISILKAARMEFSKVELKDIPRPRIGIVGEIYVRNHPFSNNEIIKKVEELGGEVDIPDFSEWAYHTNATSKLDITVKQKDLYYKLLSSLNFFNGNSKPVMDFPGNGSASANFDGGNNFSDVFRLVPNLFKGASFYVSNRIFKKILNKQKHALEGAFEGSEMFDAHEADIYDIWDNAEPYIIKWFGEAALGIGKSIDWIRKDIDGIINVLPFTCMPGTMVTAISKRIREEYGVPWLNIAFDGLEQGTTETRIEAFMYQARQYMKNKSQE
jgi:predicted CoA-substrate-specific enzyme activase